MSDLDAQVVEAQGYKRRWYCQAQAKRHNHGAVIRVVSTP